MSFFLFNLLFPWKRLFILFHFRKTEPGFLTFLKEPPAVFRLSANFRLNCKIWDPPPCSSSFFYSPYTLWTQTFDPRLLSQLPEKEYTMYLTNGYSLIKVHLWWSLKILFGLIIDLHPMKHLFVMTNDL